MTGLSFLGTNPYQETTYHFKNKTCTTKFFPKALVELFGLDELNVIMTREAKKEYYEELLGEIDFQCIDIPSGKNEEEIWDMFTAIVNVVPEKAHLVVDITHGFRSQPFLMLSALIFLRMYKNITIEGIYYGAYKARNEQTNIAPVFDLTPFLETIDWTFAIRRFTEKGDARELSEIMNKVQLHSRTTKKDGYKASYLQKTGNNLSKLMQALATIRPNEVVKTANNISIILPNVQKDLNQMPQTKPMAVMIDRIKEQTGCYQSEKEDLFSKKGFHIQTEMLSHYLEINQYQQALTLSVEMLYSLACVKHQKDPFDRDDREEVSDRLHSINKVEKVENIASWEKEMSKILDLGSEYRNDINHAGMRKNPKPAATIIGKTEEIVEKTIQFVNKHTNFDKNASKPIQSSF